MILSKKKATNSNNPLGIQATITENDCQNGEDSILEYDWPLQFVQAEIEEFNILNNVQEPINKYVKFQGNLELENINRCNEFMDAGTSVEEPDETYMEFDRKASVNYHCVVCGEIFMNNYYLNKHIMTMHEKIYECPICDIEIHGKSNFEIHIKEIHVQKTHKCSICNKLFGSSKNVKKHMSVHSDEKPYTCNICGKKFSRKDYLNSHMISHSGEKRFKCLLCDKAYTCKLSLKHHNVKMHPGEVYMFIHNTLL